MDDPNPIDGAYSVRFVSAWQFIAWTNLRKNHLQCTANYFGVISTDYWCVIISLTVASDSDRFVSVKY